MSKITVCAYFNSKEPYHMTLLKGSNYIFCVINFLEVSNYKKKSVLKIEYLYSCLYKP